MSRETILRTPRLRAWRLLLGILAVGALAVGGVYLWQWLHRPPELRVVGRWPDAMIAATTSGGYALYELVPGGSGGDRLVRRIVFRDWSGREIWSAEGGERSLRADREHRLSPDGRWFMYVERDDGWVAFPTITLLHDGRQVRREMLPLWGDCFQFTDNGTAWAAWHEGDIMSVCAMRPDRTLVGRTHLPAHRPSREWRGGHSLWGVADDEAYRVSNGMAPRTGIESARLLDDGTTLVLSAYHWLDAERGEVYPNYRTYRTKALHNRLVLELVGSDPHTVRQDVSAEYARSRIEVVAPDGTTWAPGPDEIGNLVQTHDARFVAAYHAKFTMQPTFLAAIRAKWAALRRAPAPSTDPDNMLVVSIYERPGILRGTARLPLGEGKHLSADNVIIAPDGHAALLHAVGTVYLLRW